MKTGSELKFGVLKRLFLTRFVAILGCLDTW